jgi:hypothetical protein
MNTPKTTPTIATATIIRRTEKRGRANCIGEFSRLQRAIDHDFSTSTPGPKGNRLQGDVESLSFTDEDAIHEFDFLGCLVQPLIELFVRPPASPTADIPLDGFHFVAPRTDPLSQSKSIWIVLQLTSGFNR